MFAQVKKQKKDKNRAIADPVVQKKSNGKKGFGFVDNRPEAIVQRKSQEMASKRSRAMPLKAFQHMADSSRQSVQLLTADSSSPTGFSAEAPIQKYAASGDGNYNVSENNLFAVPRNQQYPKTMLTSDGQAPLAFEGGLAWDQGGGVQIDGIDFVSYQADISEYEAEHGPGAEKHCGAFARELSGVNQTVEQSTSAAGGVLYDSNTTPDAEDDGWDNHYASVVKVDDGDHATYETAVGIQNTWVGIYGTEVGHTFKFKTQMANIERMMNMPDFVVPARMGIEQSFWQWLFCRPGNLVEREPEARYPRGISAEQGEIYQQEMLNWRDNGTEPQSEYMRQVVQKLIQEAEQLN